MARHWIRNWKPVNMATSLAGVFKYYTIWMIQVLGYTKTAESGAGGDWTSTESSGTGGSFTGSNYVFTDTGASFSSSDIGKHIIVKDTSEPRNSGVYLITAAPSSTTLKIGFYAEEYPFSSSGIYWWILGPNYQRPGLNGWVRLESPAGWAIQFYNSTVGESISLTTDGSWDADHTLDSVGYMRWPASGGIRVHATGDTDGGDLKLWWRTWNDTTPAGCFTMVSTITTIESGRSASLRVLACSSYSDNAFQDHIMRLPLSRAVRAFYLDPLKGGRSMSGYIYDWTAAGWRYGFATGLMSGSVLTTPYWEHNERTGGRVELFRGAPIIADYDNLSSDYSIVGILNGHYTCRGGVPLGQLLSSDGTKKDLIHIGDGFVIEWPDGIRNMDVWNPYVART